MKAKKPGTGAHIAAAMAALYAPSTPQSRAEADALAAEHCARVERGVPRHEVEEAPTDLFSAAAAGPAGGVLAFETTPAAAARCTCVAGGDSLAGLPPGDAASLSRAA